MNKTNIQEFVMEGKLMNLIIPLNQVECELLEDHLTRKVVEIRQLNGEEVWVIPAPLKFEGITLIAYKFDPSASDSEDALNKLQNQIIQSGREWMAMAGKPILQINSNFH